MSFLKDLDFDHSTLFHALSPWFPEQNLVLTFALFFPESSSELLGASLFTSLPTFLVSRETSGTHCVSLDVSVLSRLLTSVFRLLAPFRGLYP